MHHAWAFERRDGGVYVLTEEEAGRLATLSPLVTDAASTFIDHFVATLPRSMTPDRVPRHGVAGTMECNRAAG